MDTKKIDALPIGTVIANADTYWGPYEIVSAPRPREWGACAYDVIFDGEYADVIVLDDDSDFVIVS